MRSKFFYENDLFSITYFDCSLLLGAMVYLSSRPFNLCSLVTSAEMSLQVCSCSCTARFSDCVV